MDEPGVDLRVGVERLLDVAVERAVTTDVLAHEKHPHSLIVDIKGRSVRRSNGPVAYDLVTTRRYPRPNADRAG